MRLIPFISLVITSLLFFSFTVSDTKLIKYRKEEEKIIQGSLTLINDTKEKVSIYTGAGFVSLNKGVKTSIGCNIGKEVCWAKSGRKGEVIFKIASKHCGKAIKLSKIID